MAKLHALCGKAGVQGGATARASVCRLWLGNAPPFFCIFVQEKSKCSDPAQEKNVCICFVCASLVYSNFFTFLKA